MPSNIRNNDVDKLAEALANRLRITKTEAVKLALENEPQRECLKVPLSELLRPLQARIAKRPATGLEADKSFYDDLNE